MNLDLGERDLTPHMVSLLSTRVADRLLCHMCMRHAYMFALPHCAETRRSHSNMRLGWQELTLCWSFAISPTRTIVF